MPSSACGVCGVRLPRPVVGRHCPPIARRAPYTAKGVLYGRWVRFHAAHPHITQNDAAPLLGVTYAALVQSIRRGRAREAANPPRRRLRSSSEGMTR